MAQERLQDSHDEDLYFGIQADIGITKHMGGKKATLELVELCHVQRDQFILEIGSGLGRTACYLAEEHGCRVVGVDISERMVERSRDRARRRGLESRVEFRLSDAQELPFGDQSFDVVMDESVTAFVADKHRAASEYARVVKSGGYVGLNEATWMETPSPDLVSYVYFIMGKADFLTSEGWKEVLSGTGLTDLQAKSYKFDARRQMIEELRQLDLREYFGAWGRFLTQGVANPAYRRFTKQVLSSPGKIFEFMRSIGYGIYVGRKA